MVKTGVQIKTMAQTYAEGMPISDTNTIIWINNFLVDKLRVKAYLSSTQIYPDSVANTDYTLPATFKKIWSVESYADAACTEPNKYGEFYGFSLSDDHIQFDTGGNFKLTYFYLPAPITAISGPIAIDDVFYHACALWVAYCALTDDDEDNALPNSLGMQRFREYHVAMAEAMIEVKQRRTKRHRIRRWRVG